MHIYIYIHIRTYIHVICIRRPQQTARGSALGEKCRLLDHGPGEHLKTEYCHQLGGFRRAVATSVGAVAKLVAV